MNAKIKSILPLLIAILAGISAGVALRVVNVPGLLSVFQSPSPKHAALVGKSILVYGTGTCSHCNNARQFLAERRIEFVDLRIDASAEAKEMFASLGEDAVPLIFISGQKIVGFNEKAVLKALEERQQQKP